MEKPDPSPEEIAAACAAIRLTWTARERKLRRHRATHLEWERDRPLTVPIIDTSALGVDQRAEY